MILGSRTIHALATDKGGFTGAVWAKLKALFPDIEFTPGWVYRLTGREVTEAQYADLLALRQVYAKKQRLPVLIETSPRPTVTAEYDGPLPWEDDAPDAAFTTDTGDLRAGAE